MNAIVGFSKLALETSLDRKQHEYITSINNAAGNLLTLVNDVLDFSKIEAGKLTLEHRPFKLSDTLAEVERLFRTELRKRNLHLVVEDTTPEHPDFPDRNTDRRCVASAAGAGESGRQRREVHQGRSRSVELAKCWNSGQRR